MLKTAVIGVGNMGKHHARVYTELDSELVAVSDPDEKRGKEIAEKFSCKYYSDYKEMLEKEKIDAVSVAVPTKFHKDVCLYCIENGKHVLVEKPIADKIEDARAIIDAAKSKGIKLLVGHVERFNPAVQKLKEIIDKREIGDITSIIARRVGVFPPQVLDANVIIDLAVHDIDIVNYILGKQPTAIYASGGKALIDKREDYADIFMKFGKTNVLIQANWITPVKIRNISVTGTNGYAEVNYITQELKIYKTKLKKNFDTFNDVVEFAKPAVMTITMEGEEPLKLEIENFLESIRENKEPLVTGEDGLNAIDIALKATKMCNDKQADDMVK
ncbi:MAG: Gfo/Idh/MocA family oxidoreductase [Nanoarchaeota archaeon]|nr:Gfo/Idh/MocA family oxidoreductase [Nanoarchaeota archaeon]MBU2519947.1 Gfo/Idh/MocA family oxidoreductase [Nanoarchaeota archaeon]